MHEKERVDLHTHKENSIKLLAIDMGISLSVNVNRQLKLVPLKLPIAETEFRV